MSKIIGNTTATPNPRPDWEQTDETKADYIKNKPTVLSEEDVVQLIVENGGGSGGGGAIVDGAKEIYIGPEEPTDDSELWIDTDETYGPVIEYNNSFVTPEMFGAVGDGKTNDLDALQKAFNNEENLPVKLINDYYVERVICFDKFNPDKLYARAIEVEGRDNLIVYGNNHTIRCKSHSLISSTSDTIIKDDDVNFSPNSYCDPAFVIFLKRVKNAHIYDLKVTSEHNEYSSSVGSHNPNYRCKSSNVFGFKIYRCDNINLYNISLDQMMYDFSITYSKNIKIDGWNSHNTCMGLYSNDTENLTVSNFNIKMDSTNTFDGEHAFYLNKNMNNVLIANGYAELINNDRITPVFSCHSVKPNKSEKNIKVSNVKFKGVWQANVYDHINVIEFDNCEFIHHLPNHLIISEDKTVRPYSKYKIENCNDLEKWSEVDRDNAGPEIFNEIGYKSSCKPKSNETEDCEGLFTTGYIPYNCKQLSEDVRIILKDVGFNPNSEHLAEFVIEGWDENKAACIKRVKFITDNQNAPSYDTIGEIVLDTETVTSTSSEEPNAELLTESKLSYSSYTIKQDDVEYDVITGVVTLSNSFNIGQSDSSTDIKYIRICCDYLGPTSIITVCDGHYANGQVSLTRDAHFKNCLFNFNSMYPGIVGGGDGLFNCITLDSCTLHSNSAENIKFASNSALLGNRSNYDIVNCYIVWGGVLRNSGYSIEIADDSTDYVCTRVYNSILKLTPYDDVPIFTIWNKHLVLLYGCLVDCGKNILLYTKNKYPKVTIARCDILTKNEEWLRAETELSIDIHNTSKNYISI